MNFNLFKLDQFLATTFGANSNSTFFFHSCTWSCRWIRRSPERKLKYSFNHYTQFSYDSSKTGFIVFIIEQLCRIPKITPLRSHPQVIRAAFDKHSLQQNNTFCREKCLSKRSDEIFVRHKSHQCWRLFSSLPARSRSRVPGAGDHQWQRLRLSHTAWPIETRGLRSRPKKCDQCLEAQDYTKGGRVFKSTNTTIFTTSHRKCANLKKGTTTMMTWWSKSIGSLYTTTSPKSTHHRLQILIFQISAIQIRVFLVVYFYHRKLPMMFVDASHPQETALTEI